MMSWPSAGASAVRTELYRLLEVKKGVTAIIGSGGKTSLMLRLCRELPGTVILCTSTHIFPAEGLPLVTGRVEALPFEKFCLGTPAENGKLTAPEQSFEDLAKRADYVLVEADGAKGLPLKAHLDYEPVIPTCANLVLQVVGLSGLGRPIGQVAHRPERFAELCGASLKEPAIPERIAKVLNTENLGDMYVLNQADDLEEQKWGRTLGALLKKPFILTCLKDENHG